MSGAAPTFLGELQVIYLHLQKTDIPYHCYKYAYLTVTLKIINMITYMINTSPAFNVTAGQYAAHGKYTRV